MSIAISIADKPKRYANLGDCKSLSMPMAAISAALNGNNRVLLRLITVARSSPGI